MIVIMRKAGDFFLGNNDDSSRDNYEFFYFKIALKYNYPHTLSGEGDKGKYKELTGGGG